MIILKSTIGTQEQTVSSAIRRADMNDRIASDSHQAGTRMVLAAMVGDRLRA